jgi:Phytochelatin synthase
MTRTRKLFLSISCAVVVAGGLAVGPSLLFSGQADTRVASIKLEHDYQDPALLEKAWQLPIAQQYHTDVEFQRNPSVCGPTSLANVLHSFGQKGDQESVLQGTGVSTVMGYLPMGITLDELAGIARQKAPAKVTVLRDLTLESFREQMHHVNDSSRRYVINFTRTPLFGTGGGHHSPIAGYLLDEDLVLVLDVNKNYGPWLVKSQRLFEAMDTTDSTAKKKRGLLLIEMGNQPSS